MGERPVFMVVDEVQAWALDAFARACGCFPEEGHEDGCYYAEAADLIFAAPAQDDGGGSDG